MSEFRSCNKIRSSHLLQGQLLVLMLYLSSVCAAPTSINVEGSPSTSSLSSSSSIQQSDNIPLSFKLLEPNWPAMNVEETPYHTMAGSGSYRIPNTPFNLFNLWLNNRPPTLSTKRAKPVSFFLSLINSFRL